MMMIEDLNDLHRADAHRPFVWPDIGHVQLHPTVRVAPWGRADNWTTNGPVSRLQVQR